MSKSLKKAFHRRGNISMGKYAQLYESSEKCTWKPWLETPLHSLTAPHSLPSYLWEQQQYQWYYYVNYRQFLCLILFWWIYFLVFSQARLHIVAFWNKSDIFWGKTFIFRLFYILVCLNINTHDNPKFIVPR